MKYVKPIDVLSSRLFSCLTLSSPNIVGHANDTVLGYRPPFDVPTCSFSIPFSTLSLLVTVRYSAPFRGRTCNLVLSTYLHFQFLLVSQPSHCP